MTVDRIVHGVISVLFVAVFIYSNKEKIAVSRYAPVLLAALLGSWVPDWDLILGVGAHRNPLTHSALPAALVGWITFKLRWPVVFVGFSLGLASHLLWDIVAFGDVRWIPGGNNDRVFLLGNGAVLLILSYVVGRKIGAVKPRESSIGKKPRMAPPDSSEN